MHNILQNLEHFSLSIKLAMVSLVGVLATVGDAFTQPNTLEDWGMKGILLVAVGVLYRLLIQTQKEHKAEIKELQLQHNHAVIDVVTKNTEAVNKLVTINEEQTNYFRAVTRNIVDEKLAKKPDPKLP